MNEELEVFLKFLFKDFLNNVNDPSNLLHKFIISFIIIVIWIGFLKVGKKTITSFFDNIKVITTLYKIWKNIVGAIAVLILLVIWMKVQQSLLFILIVILLLTAFSIKNLSTNLVAWFMLLRKQYFKLYDRIEINGIKGDVIKITPFYFKMIERGNSLSSSSATGRVIHMPNHILLNNPLYNYNELIEVNWGEVAYYITVDSDWKQAKVMIEKEVHTYLGNFLSRYKEHEVKQIHRKTSLFDEELKMKTYVLINEEAIQIVAQFPIEYTEGTSTKSLLNEAIIPKLHTAENIELSGKTYHLHMDNMSDLTEK